MQDRRLASRALRWIRKAMDAQGRVAVPIGTGTRPRVDRYVMVLLVAGLLQPVGVTRRDSQPDHIVYALTDDGDGNAELPAREDWTDRAEFR